MLNHVRTLLLNANASTVDAWYVDSRFIPLRLDGSLEVFRNMLFAGAGDISEYEARVSEIMPFTLDPEFADARSLFDNRVTLESDDPERVISYSTVFSFYYRLSQEQIAIVNNCVNNYRTPELFTWNDVRNDRFTDCMRRMHNVYRYSKEACKRFSACLWAYLIRLETIRRRSQVVR